MARVRVGGTGPSGGSNDPFVAMFKIWARLYSTMLLRRYRALSRGGSWEGERWQDLADSTKASRRQGRGNSTTAAGTFSILIDKGLLRDGLIVGNPGNFVAYLKDRMRFGFSESTHKESGLTFRSLAVIHSRGDGVPARPILAVPDRRTREQMIKQLGRAVERKYRV